MIAGKKIGWVWWTLILVEAWLGLLSQRLREVDADVRVLQARPDARCECHEDEAASFYGLSRLEVTR